MEGLANVGQEAEVKVADVSGSLGTEEVKEEGSGLAEAVEGTEPEVEQTAEQAEDSLPFHKHPRFRELYETTKRQEKIIAELNQKLQPKEEVPDFEKELLGLGFGEDAAKKFLATLDKYYGFKSKDVGSLKEEIADLQRHRVIEVFAAQHSDYNTLEPEMVKIYDGLPKHVQEAFKNDKTDRSVLMLYNEAKAQTKSDFVKGQKVATKNAQKKEAVSGKGKSTGTTKHIYTSKEIGEMTSEDFKTNEAEIDRQYKQGLIK